MRHTVVICVRHTALLTDRGRRFGVHTADRRRPYTVPEQVDRRCAGVESSERKLVGIDRFAEMTSIGVTLAKRLVRDGEVASVHVGHRVLIPVAEIDRFIERKLAESGAAR